MHSRCAPSTEPSAESHANSAHASHPLASNALIVISIHSARRSQCDLRSERAAQTIDEFVDLGAGVVPPRGFAVLRYDDRGSRTASAAFNATLAFPWLMTDVAGNAFVWGLFEGAIRLGTDMQWVEPPGRKAFVMKLAAEPFPGSPPSPCPAPPDGPLLAGLQLDVWDIPRAIANYQIENLTALIAAVAGPAAAGGPAAQPAPTAQPPATAGAVR